MKAFFSGGIIVAALCAGTTSARAQVQSECVTTQRNGTPGATLLAGMESQAWAKFCDGTAGYTSDAYVFGGTNGTSYVGTGHITPYGSVVDAGMFYAGDELVFSIYVRNTGFTYFSGPGDRNPDGKVHAALTYLGNDEYAVGFEDLFGGGDQDFDDINFVVRVEALELDLDGDGVGDATDNCPVDANPDQSDLDGDVFGDACDACAFDPDNDADGDGVCGNDDLCPFAADSQADSDGDGFGDACDVCPFDAANDGDGDGVCGDVDNCPSAENSSQADVDGDGNGDACDPDSDNDGVDDANDNCVLDPNADQRDLDADGNGDACDSDDDGDGVNDGGDACPGSASGATVEANGCSIADACPCDSVWKNHGAYVKCVTQTAQRFVAAGLMTSAQKDATVSAAGQSGCGS